MKTDVREERPTPFGSSSANERDDCIIAKEELELDAMIDLAVVVAENHS